MERNHRTSVQGVVTSVNMAKTIVVTVSTERNHPMYNKRVGYSKKYYAHDENGVAQVGDTVTIMACRPISKLKRFRLVSVDKKAVIAEAAADVEASLEAAEGSAAEVETKEAE
ncbi:MAG: 30S ribosomal protein S17 [Bacilli bacterium]|nr:30S ribosomal protein S17 [Bacilli bacterium]